MCCGEEGCPKVGDIVPEGTATGPTPAFSNTGNVQYFNYGNYCPQCPHCTKCPTCGKDGYIPPAPYVIPDVPYTPSVPWTPPTIYPWTGYPYIYTTSNTSGNITITYSNGPISS